MRPIHLSGNRYPAHACAVFLLTLPASAGELGKMTREVWNDIPGAQLSAFTSSAHYWQAADSVSTFSGAVAPSDTVDHFAARVRAYVTAPISGNYTFWITSDDDSELYLSINDSKFQRVKIASLSGYVNPLDWDFKPSQKSMVISLVAGQRYFIEALHKDGVYGDHLAIAWAITGGTRELIPPSALESFTADSNDLDNDDLLDDWEVANGFNLTDNGTMHPEQHPLADPDHDGHSNLEESRLATDPNPEVGTIAGEPGKMTREIWFNIPGGQLTTFTSSSRYWQAADAVSTFSGGMSPSDTADSFAARIRAYVTAPTSGDYTFWIASDDDSELYLSTDRSQFNRKKIASLSGYVNPFDWEVRASQRSVVIPLVAGQSYFIEALHKDGVFGDHVEIAWQIPGGIRQLLPPYAIESFTVDWNDLDSDELPDDWETAHGFSIADNGVAHPDQHPLADPDHDGYSNLEESTFATDPYTRGGVPGTLLLETWSSLPGINITDLTWRTTFMESPDISEFVYSAETPPDRADNYGARMRGYVIAPVTGNYTFHLSGDDACELWFSGSDSQFTKQKVAFQPGWSNLRDWTKFESQRSTTIPLVAGRKYYIEALQKEMYHGDHLEIGWTLPESTSISVIPSGSLESYAYDSEDLDGDNMPLPWEEAHGLDPAVNDASLDMDFDGIPNGLEYAGGTDPQVKNSFAGALLHELWWDVPSFSIHSQVAAQRMLQLPDEHTLSFSTQGAVNYGDAYADRYRGYLTAPVTGTYTFWAVGDEETEFWLSTSANKFKKELLVHPGPQIRDFDADFSMKSRAVTLQAGDRYYLEILHVNHHGGDFCEVAWQPPGGPREIIPGSVLTSYIPVANDRDDDDLPDDWELANGLDPNDNGHTNPQNGAQGDLDGDGLSNEDELNVGTRAGLADTDGDGVSDRDEIEMMETQALTADTSPFQSIAIIPGAAYTAASGSWIQENNKARQDCARGWLDYSVTLAAAGVYQVDLAFTPGTDAGVSPDYEIVFSVDGKTIRRENVTTAERAIGHAKILSPWLDAGSHTLRVLIDNSYHFRRVTVDQLEVLAARGPDANSNGKPDWIDLRLAKNNSLEGPSESITSPVCLEGKSRWYEMCRVNGAPVQAAPNDRWFANVPLNANQPTGIIAVLENGGVTATRQVIWSSVNLLASGDLTIRQGDSLQLSAYKNSSNSNKPYTLTLGGQSYTISGQYPLVQRFDTPGNIPIQISGSGNGNGNGGTTTVTVHVIAAPLLQSPVCVTGYYREVSIPALPAGVSLQLDNRIEISSTTAFPAGSQLHILRLNTLDDRPAVLRLGGTTGTILASLPFRAMRVRDGSQTGQFLSGFLGANQWDVAMPVVVDGNFQGTSLTYDIFIGGVVFDGGLLTRTLLPESHAEFQWSELLHFFKIGNNGSTCHRASVWQGNLRIAYFQ